MRGRIIDEYISLHKHMQALYEELLKEVKGIKLHTASLTEFDSNYWLCTVTFSSGLKIRGLMNAYKYVITGAVGGAVGVTHATKPVTTDCQPNYNVKALCFVLYASGIKSRPLWKPLHKQPVYKDVPAYVNSLSESLFRVGICRLVDPYVTDEHVQYIVDQINAAIE